MRRRTFWWHLWRLVTFRSPRIFEDVAEELVEGLEDGSIVLDAGRVAPGQVYPAR